MVDPVSVLLRWPAVWTRRWTGNKIAECGHVWPSTDLMFQVPGVRRVWRIITHRGLWSPDRSYFYWQEFLWCKVSVLRWSQQRHWWMWLQLCHSGPTHTAARWGVKLISGWPPVYMLDDPAFYLLDALERPLTAMNRIIQTLNKGPVTTALTMAKLCCKVSSFQWSHVISGFSLRPEFNSVNSHRLRFNT